MTPALTPLVHQSFSPLRMKCAPSSAGFGVGFHLGGVGADLRLGEREGGDFAAGDAREEPALLLLGAEEDERLRDADGLMGGEEGGEVAAIAAEEHSGAAVVGLGEAEAAVFGEDLDAEGAEFGEAVDDFIGDFAGAVDFVGIDVLGEEIAEAGEKGVALVASPRPAGAG